tara:strand:+ start:754 stop:1566 length:813 start_codon:yes stop_codon:yes gene_type:complete
MVIKTVVNLHKKYIMEIEKKINKEIEIYTNELTRHRLYNHLKSLKDIRVFTYYHVFAVWDFMSLLKSLQKSLTCIETPWIPNNNSNTARFINEIVLAEETDVDKSGSFKSHFDMYLEAMQEIGADTNQISKFINYLKDGISVYDALDKSDVDPVVSEFVRFTFDIINTKKDHIIASVFTFGREGLIADMFIEILNNSSNINQQSYHSMIYYLERHIELDGDEHGPMAMKMIKELCGGDDLKIKETIKYAKKALEYRIKLWDRIADAIQQG